MFYIYKVQTMYHLQWGSSWPWTYGS